MVIKRGFSVFWWLLCSLLLLYFDRPLEKFETFSVPQNTLKITGYGRRLLACIPDHMLSMWSR